MAKNEKIDWTRVADFEGIGSLDGKSIVEEYARLTKEAGQLKNGELVKLEEENSRGPSTSCNSSVLNNNGVNIVKTVVNLDGGHDKVPDQEIGFYLIGNEGGPVTLIEESREYQPEVVEDRVANYSWKTIATVGEQVSPEGDVTKMSKQDSEFQVAMVKGLFAAAEASQAQASNPVDGPAQ